MNNNRSLLKLPSLLYKVAMLKAFSRLEGMMHPIQNSWSSIFPGTNVNHAARLGNGLKTDVFMSPIQYVGRQFSQAIPAVEIMDREGNTELDFSHDMVKLLGRPNPYYSASDLWMATIISWFLCGNAYWLKVRGSNGRPQELWYVPHWLIEPIGDKNSFISHYQYTPLGTPVKLDPKNVVHLRFGVDPENVRKGLGPLASAVRKAFMDSEADNWVAAILANAGVPGLIIAPDSDQADASIVDAENIKNYAKAKFTGDSRWEPLVLTAKTKVHQLGFDPGQMDLGVVHNLAEERVCALIGLPAAIVGFGSGMEQTKVGATLVELRKLAWEDCIIPTAGSLAEDLTRSLGPDFGLSDSQALVFDSSKVPALQANITEITTSNDIGVRGGWIMVSEAREALGKEVKDSDKIYLRSAAVFPVGEDGVEVFGPPNPNAPSFEPAAPADESLEDEAEDLNEAMDEDTEKAIKANKRMTRQQAGIARAMGKMRDLMERRMKGRLKSFLAGMGKAFEDMWLQIEANHPKSFKQTDDVIVALINDRMNFDIWEKELGTIMQSQYSAVFKQSLGILNEFGLVVNAPDQLEAAVLREGGTRLGLIEFSENAQRSALEVIAQGREAGLGPKDIARTLRHRVPAGRFLNSQTRAELIARTETRYAQTFSSMKMYEQTDGVSQVMMIDARLGPTDADCEAMNGRVVSFQEGQRLLDEEHPNGTRDIVPVVG